MRRFVITSLALILHVTLFAQTDTTVTTVRNATAATLPRSGDHLLLQAGYTTWLGKTPVMRTGGIPRTFNAYFLFDFPFKTNPHWSVAIGPGIAVDNMYFDETYVGIKDLTTNLQFRDVSDTSHFKKYKLVTAYAEAPIELRFTLNPENSGKSFKAALGVKIGTLLNAHTKGKTLQNSSDNTLNDYIVKENSKRFFNQNRLSATARLGVGHFSLFGSYQITSLFKEGVAPTIRPLTIGLTVSGL